MITKLENQIRKYSEAYYLGEPIATDEEFEDVVEKLRAVDPTNPILTQVGWGLSIYGTKVPLPCVIRHSLNKIHDVIPEWTNCKISPKVDGMTVILEYVDGVLKQAVTRGDGRHGIDITQKALRIKTVPRQFNPEFSGCIRGELYISIQTFLDNISSEYANPRNATSGILNRKGFEHLEYVDFAAHPVSESERVVGVDYLLEFTSGSDSYNPENIRKMIHDLSYYPYDGAVLRKPNSNEAIALKFKADSVITTIRDIEWSSKRGGKLVPTAVYDEVQLSGTKCTRVTALHYQYVKENKLGPGAVVEIQKANEIIPQIIRVISPATVPESDYLPKDHYVESGVHAISTKFNDYHSALTHFVKWHFDLDGFKRSEFIIFDVFKLTTFEGVKLLRESPPDWIEKCLNEAGIHSYAKPWIENLTSTLKVDHFIEQFGFDGVGETAAEAFDLEFFKTHKYTLSVATPTEVDLFVYEISDESNSIKGVNSRVRDRLRENRSIIREAYATFSSIWVDKHRDPPASSEFVVRACISGKLSIKKSEFAELLNSANVEYVDYVDKTIEYLIIPDESYRESSKVQKAKKLGVEILTEEQAVAKWGLF